MTEPADPTLQSTSGTEVADTDEAYCSACSQSFPADTITCPNDGARLIRLAAERDELLGKILDGRYEIRAPLGKGGMGTVYRGWQLSVDREVAIKVIHPKLANDRSAVKRFLREARLASRLSQPSIVNVYDFGQSDGILYLVMELLRGHTLASELGQGRRINPKRTLGIASQLCDALEGAHAQGIVHRDLKPSNIVMLDDPPGRDLLKVLDFGLAKSLIQDSGSVVTNTDALLGTPLYMAPEQIEGKVSDQRADLYSLGCILYEMLSGQPPFVDTVVSAVLARHVADTPGPLPSHVPGMLRGLIERLLAKAPEARVQTAGEVRTVLEHLREMPSMRPNTPHPVDSADTMPDVSIALAETNAAMSRPEAVAPPPVTPERRPRRPAIVAIAGIGVVGVAALAFGLTRGGDHASRSTSPGDGGATTSEPRAAAIDAPVVIDAGMSRSPDAAVRPPLARDAGVRVPPDHGHGKPAHGHPGTNEPTIDFYPPGK